MKTWILVSGGSVQRVFQSCLLWPLLLRLLMWWGLWLLWGSVLRSIRSLGWELSEIWLCWIDLFQMTLQLSIRVRSFGVQRLMPQCGVRSQKARVLILAVSSALKEPSFLSFRDQRVWTLGIAQISSTILMITMKHSFWRSGTQKLKIRWTRSKTFLLSEMGVESPTLKMHLLLYLSSLSLPL